MRPSWPASRAWRRKRSAVLGVARDEPRQQRCVSDTIAASRSRALRVGQRDQRALALAVEAVEEEGRQRQLGAARPRRPSSGRSGASSPGTDAAARRRAARSSRPPAAARAARGPRAHSTSSGTRAVTSWSWRVKTRTSSPALWSWMRAPSSLYSKAASPRRSSASVDVLRRAREHGRDRRQQAQREAARGPPRPPPRAARATSPRLAANIAAWRTSPGGRPAACAIASCTRPSSAPWRTSPSSSSARKRRSSSRARSSSARKAAVRALGRAGAALAGQRFEGAVQRRAGRAARPATAARPRAAAWIVLPAEADAALRQAPGEVQRQRAPPRGRAPAAARPRSARPSRSSWTLRARAPRARSARRGAAPTSAASVPPDLRPRAPAAQLDPEDIARRPHAQVGLAAVEGLEAAAHVLEADAGSRRRGVSGSRGFSIATQQPLAVAPRPHAHGAAVEALRDAVGDRVLHQRLQEERRHQARPRRLLDLRSRSCSRAPKRTFSMESRSSARASSSAKRHTVARAEGQAPAQEVRRAGCRPAAPPRGALPRGR